MGKLKNNSKENILLIFMLTLSLIFSLTVGRYEISVVEVMKSMINLFSKDFIKDMDLNILLNIRIPRVIIVMVSGAALGISGFIYQSVFRNPLVSPDVMGVSSGASVGAIIGLLYMKDIAVSTEIMAFIGGILVVLGSLVLSKFIARDRIFSMVISGIILGSFANSIIMWLKYNADPTRELAVIEYWLMGSFNNSTWKDTYILIPIVVSCIFFLSFFVSRLKILAVGDEDARGLGINVRALSVIAIAISTLMVAVVVSISGIISWVGLIIPHMAKIFFNQNYYRNFVQSGIMGSSLLLIADTLSRTLQASEIPISILTSFMGACFLIFVLNFKSRKL